MFFEEGATYHVYNRSNETLFHNRDNYLYFIRKIRIHILPFADILAYCIMPNHFHLILNVNHEGVRFSTKKKREDMQMLSQSLGTVLSSYTQAVNNQTGRRGVLFAHKTKSKILNDANNDYGLKNPKLAELTTKIEDWEFSSFPDFIGKRDGSLVNKALALEIFQLYSNQIFELTYKLLQDKVDEDFL